MTSFFCAGQVSPSGGPVDTTPPQIIFSFPSRNTLNFQGHAIELSFSKYVDRSSLEQSLFFSPPVGHLTFDWGGTDLTILFSDQLRDNTTYIMTVGTDVVDLRNHNRMAEAYSLAFSTGEHLDSASITGKVFDEQPAGVMVYAYRLDERNADTLNPSSAPPEYLTQTGKDGLFTLSHLAIGSYRLIAVRDQYKNLLYDRQIDDYGVTDRDVTVGGISTSVSGIQFRMTKEDTSLPFLSKAGSPDRSHLLLRFNEPMDTTTTVERTVEIIDTVHSAKLGWFDISFDPFSPNQAYVATAQQESAAVYRITLSGWNDRHGNHLSSKGSSTIVYPSLLPDTTQPTFDIAGISDHAVNVQRDDTLHVTFDEPVRRRAFEHGCRLTDTLANKVEGNFLWSGSMSVCFLPTTPLKLGESFIFTIIMDSVQDIQGNSYHDSVWTRRFMMVEERYLGSIKGIVIDEKQSATGSLHILASEISHKGSKRKETMIASPGPFEFNNLSEGKYTLSVYRDRDSNNTYSYGRPFPFQSAERFSEGLDTLRVRARWPLEGVVLRLR